MSKEQKISDTLPIIQYIGNGTAIKFPFPFMVFKKNDIIVYLGAERVNEGFNFEIVEGIEGGNLIFNTAPASGLLITIARDLSFEVMALFTDGGYLHPQVLNTEFNHTVGLCQQLRSNVSRCLQYPVYQRGMDPVLPDAAVGHAIVWNNDGTGFRNSKFTIDDSIETTIKKAEEAAASAVASEESNKNSAEEASAAAESAKKAAVSALFAEETVRDFDQHAMLKQQEFDENSELKTENEIKAFNENADEKQKIINESVSAAAVSEKNAAGSASDAKRFRDEAEKIIDIPPASVALAGVAYIASPEEMMLGIDNGKIVTPALAKQELDKKITEIIAEKNADFDTFTQTGIYHILIDVTENLHQPVKQTDTNGCNWLLKVFNYQNSNVLQEASCVLEGAGSVIWRRQRVSSAWTEWVLIAQDIRNNVQSMFQETINVDGTNIVLSSGITGYWAEVSEETTFSIDESNIAIPSDKIGYIDLIIVLSQATAVHWPVNTWLNDDVPDLSSPGIYFVTFVKLKNSSIWRGSYQGRFSS